MGGILKIVKVALILGVCCFLGMKGSDAQQLPQFSQYMFNGLHINPAYAGYKGEHYLQSTYRSQWVDFPGAPKTFTATGDFSANEGRMGFGASFMTDQFGPAKTNAFMGSYAYRIQTGEDSYLGLGASAGAIEYAIDGTFFNPGDLDDPDVPQGVLNAFTPNLNTGVFFHTSRFYAGVSAFNLVGRKTLEDEGLALAYHNLHYYVTMGGLFPLSDKVQFKPSFLVRHSDTGPTNLDLNGMVLFVERIWVGASYRTNVKVNTGLPENLSSRNALSFILELFAMDNLRLGYAYDLQNNVLSGLRNNSHELSVGYYITPRKVNMINPRWF